MLDMILQLQKSVSIQSSTERSFKQQHHYEAPMVIGHGFLHFLRPIITNGRQGPRRKNSYAHLWTTSHISFECSESLETVCDNAIAEFCTVICFQQFSWCNPVTLVLEARGFARCARNPRWLERGQWSSSSQTCFTTLWTRSMGTRRVMAATPTTWTMTWTSSIARSKERCLWPPGGISR